MSAKRTQQVLAGLDPARAWYESLYRTFHAHPELSMQEHATAARIREALAEVAGAEDAEITTGIAGTGIVAVLRNGAGPVVLLRADMDGLPVTETSGLDYASREVIATASGQRVGVMHACAHDVHMACLLGAYRLMAGARDQWSGTLVALFQPAEEAHNGAEAMVADGLVDILPTPDVAFAQHVLPGASGTVMTSPGAVTAACDDIRITLNGRGGHGAMPHATVDPVVMAASLVLRLQTIVSREVDPRQTAVLTIGLLQAGTKNNIIPDQALIDLTVRTYDEGVAAHAVAAVERLARAEAAAARAAEPDIVVYDSLPVTVNDPAVTRRLQAAFGGAFGDRSVPMRPMAGSEDFSVIPRVFGAPYCFWGLGAFDPDAWQRSVDAGTVEADFPGNHSPSFVPLMQPTLDTGVSALVVASMEWLGLA